MLLKVIFKEAIEKAKKTLSSAFIPKALWHFHVQHLLAGFSLHEHSFSLEICILGSLVGLVWWFI